MKMKIQLLSWDNEAELQSCVEQLSVFANQLGVKPIQLRRLDSGNIFVIPLPEDEQPLCWVMNAFVAWTGIHKHSVQLMPEYYADDEF